MRHVCQEALQLPQAALRLLRVGRCDGRRHRQAPLGALHAAKHGHIGARKRGSIHALSITGSRERVTTAPDRPPGYRSSPSLPPAAIPSVRPLCGVRSDAPLPPLAPPSATLPSVALPPRLPRARRAARSSSVTCRLTRPRPWQPWPQRASTAALTSTVALTSTAGLPLRPPASLGAHRRAPLTRHGRRACASLRRP
jgi:hypothetical protein